MVRVTLAALIAAYHDADAPETGLRATLPLAGRTVVERQARLAASAGAAPVIILVERVPPELLAAIDRMRAEGLNVVIARNAAEAAESVHPDDRLLLLADGLVADEAHVRRILDFGSNTLLTLPHIGADDRFERIDAHSRWAGLALITGQSLRQTAAMLQDWDAQSTLLRRTVQAGARQFSIRGEIEEAHLTIAAGRGDLVDIEKHILEGAVARRDGWVSRYLLAIPEQAATRFLMPTMVTPDWLRILAVGLTTISLFLFVDGWLWAGAALLLLSTPLDDIADRLAMLRMQSGERSSWWTYLLPATASAALLGVAYAISPVSGWGCIAVAAATLAFVAALWLEIGDREVEGQIFLAERKGMIWLMLPFAITGSWTTGLVALAAYAAGSFFWAQHRVHRRIVPDPQN